MSSSCSSLSGNRALVRDILHYDRRIPSFVHSRTANLGRLAELRSQATTRISWSILFIKAYGLLSAECPELRQTWMSWPWPHRYQHPQSIGVLTISRRHQEEERLCFLRLRRPETYTLSELQTSLARHQQEPVERCFARQLQLSRLPTPLRRLGWWTTFHLSGDRKARRMGTFALTTLAAEEVDIDRPPSIHTSTLTYGPLDAAGRCRMAITYDHRLMDGLLIARCLRRLEELLCGAVADEVQNLGRAPRRLAS